MSPRNTGPRSAADELDGVPQRKIGAQAAPDRASSADCGIVGICSDTLYQ